MSVRSVIIHNKIDLEAVYNTTVHFMDAIVLKNQKEILINKNVFLDVADRISIKHNLPNSQ